MRIKKIKKKQIFLYLPFLIIPKVQKEPNCYVTAFFLYRRMAVDPNTIIFLF